MNFIKRVYLSLWGIGLTAMTLVSCNFILEDTAEKDKWVEQTVSQVQVNKEEANILLKASKTNLDIIVICGAIKEVDTKTEIKRLATDLEKTHIEILKNYNEIAQEKLISIPSETHIDKSIKVTDREIDDFVVNNLKVVLSKINSQIKLMDILKETTNNVDFKVLAVKDNYKLKSNLNQIESLLNTMNQSV